MIYIIAILLLCVLLTLWLGPGWLVDIGGPLGHFLLETVLNIVCTGCLVLIIHWGFSFLH